jgi:hypothetical protein
MSFLKDLSFLVVFGWLAVRITHTRDLDDFLRRSMEFVVAGFGWSISDPIWRSRFPSVAPQQPLWRAWALLDGLQWAIIYAFIQVHDAYPAYGDQLSVGVGLAYTRFLFLDFGAMIRGIRIT